MRVLCHEHARSQRPRHQVVLPCRAHAASFVQAQLLALPWHLGTAFYIGTAGFFAYVRLTTLRAFRDLTPERRAEVLETWSHGPVPLTRALFRVLRSTALLAGCEHPHVVRRLEGA